VPFGYAAAIGAAGSLANGILGSNAANKAAGQQVQAEDQALALQQQIYGTNKQNLTPYITTGTNALNNLSQLLGIGTQGGPQGANPILAMLGLGPGGTGSINPSTFQGSPGYQYQLQQGTQAVTNAAAPTGGLGGNALMQLQQTGQGVANQNWNQYLSNASNAWQQLLGNVGGLASTGLSAAGSLAGTGQNFANAAGQNIVGAGNAGAAGTIGSANAIAGGLNGIGQNATFAALLANGGNGGGGLSQLLGNIQGYGSAFGQYFNPYGATGNGMSPIIGNNGMAGGGV
jgi:hypothetical protein